MIFFNLFIASLISALAVNLPKLKRKLDFMRFSDKPQDFKTWDGFDERVEQAEPLETATPAKSNFIKRSLAVRQPADSGK